MLGEWRNSKIFSFPTFPLEGRPVQTRDRQSCFLIFATFNKDLNNCGTIKNKCNKRSLKLFTSILLHISSWSPPGLLSTLSAVGETPLGEHFCPVIPTLGLIWRERADFPLPYFISDATWSIWK